MTIQNPPNFFNELNIGDIATNVIKFAEILNEKEFLIRRIVLYRAGNGFSDGTKYVMLFELSKAENNGQEFSDNAKVILNIMTAEGGSAFLDESVFYKNNPPNQPLDEWYLIAKTPESELDFDIIQDSELVLYTQDVSEPRKKGPNQKIFDCPSGTQWKDIKITLLSNERVRIKTPNEEGSYAFHELWMLNITTKKPKKIWTVLKALAKNQGFINLDKITDEDLRKNLKKRASLLNKHLQKIFGLDGSIYDGTYNKKKNVSVGYNNIGKEIFKYKKGYKAKIIFSDATGVSTNYNRGVDSNNKSLFDQEVESVESKINLHKSKKYQD